MTELAQPVVKTTVDTDMFALLRSQHDGKVFAAVIKVIAAELQKLHFDCHHINLTSSLKQARGSRLDEFGLILKVPRNGLDDDWYLRLLVAKQMLLNSSGRLYGAVGLVEILTYMTDAIVVTNRYNPPNGHMFYCYVAYEPTRQLINSFSMLCASINVVGKGINIAVQFAGKFENGGVDTVLEGDPEGYPGWIIK